MGVPTAIQIAWLFAKRPEARRLHLAVRELPRRVDVLPWDSAHRGALRSRAG